MSAYNTVSIYIIENNLDELKKYFDDNNIIFDRAILDIAMYNNKWDIVEYLYLRAKNILDRDSISHILYNILSHLKKKE